MRCESASNTLPPAVMVFLMAAVLLLDASDPSMRIWFILALFTSLAGDIFLMLRRDMFLPGLASFLLAHIAYTVAFVLAFERLFYLLLGISFVASFNVILFIPILDALLKSRRDLVAPVIAYTVAISTMVCTAYATGNWLAGAGATFFMFSDFMIARHRFVRSVSWAPMAIIVTYHLGQAGLVLSLAG
jgi:uncharacterized membrane protein YhhN